MSPAQKEVFLIIDEYWKNFGYGPTIDDIMRLTGEKGRGNVARKMKTLIEIGVCKGLTKRSRSIRPAYINLRNIP
jgi:SOS-response transcriptional repressor LexA